MPKLHLYFHTPTPVFKARVNMVSTSYPVSAITFDNVTLGSYTDISFDMTILLGTTEGADDLGRHRVQKSATADTIYIARSSRGIEDGQLDVEDNAYITVLEDYRVWARLPYFNLISGIDYKDGDVPVGDYNTELPPLANCGSAFAGYIDAGSSLLTVQFPNDGVNLSRAMADGASISTYAWDVGDGTITVGTASDSVITATFPAGFRYVRLTVTDSNGVPHTSRTPVLAIDPANDPTVHSYTLSQSLEWRGQTLDVNIHDELDRDDYPDGTLVLFWWDEAESPGDRNHMKFVGWVDNESYNIGRDKRGVVKRTTLHCVDVCGRLAALPGFPQALSRIEDESPWSYMPSLDMNKSLWYLGFWHSTALNLADFILPEDGDDYDAMRLDSGAASLFEQMSQQAQKMVPDHYLACNAKGQMIFQKDWRLENVGDRPTSAPIITEDYWNDIQIEYSRHPKVHVLRSGAILSSTELDEDDLIPVVFSIAPSDTEAFGQGVQEHVENEGLALSQEALNKSEGHRYAMLNSRYGDFTLRDPSGSAFWDYEPAAFNRVQLNIPASLAAQRGLDFTQASGLVKSISVQYQTDKRGTVVKSSVVWMKETSGYPALTHIPEDVEDVDYIPPPPTTPPDFGLVEGVQKVAAIDSFTLGGTNLFRTNDFQTPSGSGGPTWEAIDLGITDGFLKSFVVDPFSPGYINQDGTGAVNGWAVGDQNVWRIEDMFGLTPSASVVYTFAHTISNDNNQGRTIQASFGRYFETEEDNPWLIVISHYGVHNDRPGTWCIYSQDAGATWSNEVLVSALFDEGATSNGPLNNTGLYLSPKTPGLAYATAYGQPLSPEIMEVLPMWAVGESLSGTPTNFPQVNPPSSQMFVSSRRYGDDPSLWLYKSIVLIPHEDTKRLKFEVSWFATGLDVGFGAFTGGLSHTTPSYVDTTGSTAAGFAMPASGATASGSYIRELTLEVGEVWPHTIQDYSALNTGGSIVRQTIYSGANGSASNHALVIYKMRLVEIEMFDGTIHTIPSGDNVTGFQSTDWGETWSTLPSGADSDAPQCKWVEFDGSTLVEVSDYVSQKAWATSKFSDSGIVSGNSFLCFAPPANTKRVKLVGSWLCINTRSGLSSTAAEFTLTSPGTNVSHTGVSGFEDPPGTSGSGGTTFGSFVMEATLDNPTSFDWPGTVEDIGTSSGDQSSDYGIRLFVNMSANGSPTNPAFIQVTILIDAVEIEMEDGTIHQIGPGSGLFAPGDRPSGALHVPWLNNNDELIVYSSRLKEGASLVYRTLKATGDGTTLNDISPEDGAITFAPQGYNFGIRTYDPDPSYVAMGGVGNSTSADMDDNVYAVFVSDDLGATWTKILEASDSTVFSYYTGYNVAFGADNPSILFIWGPRGVDGTDPMIAYTSDFGTTVDDRSGNLFALVGSDMDGFIGIAGGPIGG